MTKYFYRIFLKKEPTCVECTNRSCSMPQWQILIDIIQKYQRLLPFLDTVQGCNHNGDRCDRGCTYIFRYLNPIPTKGGRFCPLLQRVAANIFLWLSYCSSFQNTSYNFWCSEKRTEREIHYNFLRHHKVWIFLETP